MSNISLLEMGKTKKRGVREATISILSREFPLSIRKVYNKVKKEYNLDVTYQAIFKTIKGMLDDNILEKSEKEYKLNINWIKQLENELDIIKKNYLGDSKEKLDDLQNRINKFVAEIGPKIKEYVGKDEACVVGVSGGGFNYSIALWKYLKREGLNINFVKLDKTEVIKGDKIKLEKKEFENKKVIIADGAIYTGTTYRAIISKIDSLKKKFKIKEIKYAVPYDTLGLADFSIKSG